MNGLPRIPSPSQERFAAWMQAEPSVLGSAGSLLPQDPSVCAGAAALPLTQVCVPALDGFAQGQLAPLHLQQQWDLLPGAWLVLQQLRPPQRMSAHSQCCPEPLVPPPWDVPQTLMASSVLPQSYARAAISE